MSNRPDGILDLEAIARSNLGRIRRNLATPMLYEEIISNREGHLSHLGPVAVRTGQHTERSVRDRFLVAEGGARTPLLRGPFRQMDEGRFKGLFDRMLAYMQHKDVYVQDCHMGADLEYRIPVRIVTETAWHSLFARNLYIQISDRKTLQGFEPAYTVVHVPGFAAVPGRDRTASSAFVIVHPGQKIVLIGGTGYAGEIRQALSAVAGLLHSMDKILPLVCAVNVGPNGDAAAFLGRTGTGKTSLSSDPGRRLVGDHQHGWTDKGLFNYEWGCYARVWRLMADQEPLIHACTRRFGTILENVTVDPETRRLALEDGRLTENARAAYPIAHIPGAVREGICGHPTHMFLLTRDPYGVLPPIARLNSDQAVFAFLMTHAASLTETETEFRAPGASWETDMSDQATMLMPFEYAKLFMEKIVRHNVKCWFMNTGWCGDPEGRGERIDLAHSRSLIRAAIAGELDGVDYDQDPLFQFEIPRTCSGVPSDLLNPRQAAADEGEYELRANRLALDLIQAFGAPGDQMPESVRQMVANVPLGDDMLDVMEQLDITI